MSTPRLRVLAVAMAADASGFAVETSPGWAEAIERLASGDRFDVVLVDGDAAPASPAKIASVAERVALVVALVDPEAEHAPPGCTMAPTTSSAAPSSPAPLARRVRFAVERRRRRDRRQSAHSTDPVTGLPHRQQLVEHLSQLLALREREPAPMAVLAFRIEGLRPNRGGAESVDADTLRRKIAVRLRAGVRASDVVAAIDDDAYAVLLGSMLAPADGERVALKLVRPLLAPFMVGAIEHTVAVASGRRPLSARRQGRRTAAAARAVARRRRAGGVARGPATARDGAGRRRAAANDDR